MIRRPQKAPSNSVTDEELIRIMNAVKRPFYGSPKLDGIRCLTNNGAYTANMNLITNRFIQRVLSDPIYNGLDGELIVGPPSGTMVFNNTTGPVRAYDGEPNFTFYVFDRHDRPGTPFDLRLAELKVMDLPPRVHLVTQSVLSSIDEVRSYETRCVNKGFEGAMIRTPTGLYKQGRCTILENNIYKRKPVEEAEAKIIGFEEQMHNTNEAEESPLGYTKRSSAKAGKVGKETLGKFIVVCPLWKKSFKVGTGIGLSADLRKQIWDNRDSYRDRIIVFKYQKYGSIDAPRQPIFKGFADPSTLTNW